VYYVFDVVVLAGQNVMGEPLQKRREQLVGWAPPPQRREPPWHHQDAPRQVRLLQ